MAAGVAGIGVSKVLAGTNKENTDAETRKKKLTSKIRIAQVKVYPEKGNMTYTETLEKGYRYIYKVIVYGKGITSSDSNYVDLIY